MATIVRTDFVQATYSGNIKSGLFMYDDTPMEIENGHLVKLDETILLDHDLYACSAPSGGDDEDIYLVASPEIIYNEQLRSDNALSKFINSAGQPITLVGLEKGDIISISDEGIDPINVSAQPGNFVVPSNGDTRWLEVNALTDEKLAGLIIGKEVFNATGTLMNVIRIVRA